MDRANRSAPTGKTWLTLHWWRHPSDELAVIHVKDGTPIPFAWIDHETLEIDATFADVAAIQHTPKPNRNETGT